MTKDEIQKTIDKIDSIEKRYSDREHGNYLMQVTGGLTDENKKEIESRGIEIVSTIGDTDDEQYIEVYMDPLGDASLPSNILIGIYENSEIEMLSA